MIESLYFNFPLPLNFIMVRKRSEMFHWIENQAWSLWTLFIMYSYSSHKMFSLTVTIMIIMTHIIKEIYRFHLSTLKHARDLRWPDGWCIIVIFGSYFAYLLVLSFFFTIFPHFYWSEDMISCGEFIVIALANGK